MFKTIAKTVGVTIITILSLSIIHILSSNLYSQLCSPMEFMSIFTTPFMSQSYHCTAIRYVVDTTASNMNAWLITLGSSILACVPSPKV